MANTHSSIATDSEAALRRLVGDDATAAFEDDPRFIDSNPTANASSSGVAVQRDLDDIADSTEEEDEAAELDEDDDDLDEEDEDEEEDEDDLDDAEEEEEDEDEEIAALRAGTFDNLAESYSFAATGMGAAAHHLGALQPATSVRAAARV